MDKLEKCGEMKWGQWLVRDYIRTFIPIYLHSLSSLDCTLVCACEMYFPLFYAGFPYLFLFFPCILNTLYPQTIITAQCQSLFRPASCGSTYLSDLEFSVPVEFPLSLSIWTLLYIPKSNYFYCGWFRKSFCRKTPSVTDRWPLLCNNSDYGIPISKICAVHLSFYITPAGARYRDWLDRRLFLTPL